MAAAATTTTRQSAEERRAAVLKVAAEAFAAGGYEGTSTEDVARRAGISQPYVFRLFGSKKELFTAVVEQTYERILASFETASRGLTGDAALEAMGRVYGDLIADPVVLLVQMHSFTAAAEDPDLRRVAQKGMRKIWELASDRSGLGADRLREWLAMGMLCNMVATLGINDLNEPWAAEVLPQKFDHWPGSTGQSN